MHLFREPAEGVGVMSNTPPRGHVTLRRHVPLTPHCPQPHCVLTPQYPVAPHSNVRADLDDPAGHIFASTAPASRAFPTFLAWSPFAIRTSREQIQCQVSFQRILPKTCGPVPQHYQRRRPPWPPPFGVPRKQKRNLPQQTPTSGFVLAHLGPTN